MLVLQGAKENLRPKKPINNHPGGDDCIVGAKHLQRSYWSRRYTRPLRRSSEKSWRNASPGCMKINSHGTTSMDVLETCVFLFFVGFLVLGRFVGGQILSLN